MDKRTLYVSLVNAVIGVMITRLFSGSVLIMGLIFIAVLTLLWIERKWIFEKIFRSNRRLASAGYAVLALLFAGCFFLLTHQSRETSAIVSRVGGYLNHLKPGEYEKAYACLALSSKKEYSKERFVADHRRFDVEVRDYRIDKVTFNEFDENRAVVEVASPFTLYGQNMLLLDVTRENGEWNIVLSPQTLFSGNPGTTSTASTGKGRKEKKEGKEGKGGKVSNFFKSIF